MNSNGMKRLVYPLLASLLFCAGCQAKETLPEPDYPLSEEAAVAAVAEAGLNWRVTATDVYTYEGGEMTVHSFFRPESGVDFQTAFVSSRAPEGIGRWLTISLSEPTVAPWPEPAIPSWEHWESVLALAVGLYGGFEDAGALYRACAAEPLPMKEEILFEGTLTGGYCRIRVNQPITDWRPSQANVLFLDMFESQDAYGQFLLDSREARDAFEKAHPRPSVSPTGAS